MLFPKHRTLKILFIGGSHNNKNSAHCYDIKTIDIFKNFGEQSRMQAKKGYQFFLNWKSLFYRSWFNCRMATYFSSLYVIIDNNYYRVIKIEEFYLIIKNISVYSKNRYLYIEILAIYQVSIVGMLQGF